MTIKAPGLSALRIPYLAVRTPLELLDKQVVIRVFGTGSTAHRSLARGLQTLDTLAASAFASGELPDNGPAQPPSDGPTDAAEQTDAEADADIITDVEAVDRDGGEEPIEPAEQEEIEQLAETFLVEDELAPRSGELAENEELRRVQAEIRAKQAVESEHGQL